MVENKKSIGFQGVEGAFSHQAARQLFADADYMPYFSFDDLVQATEKAEVDYAVIPIENSTGGRVAEFHHLLLDTNLQIIEEFFMPIKHDLLGFKASTLDDIRQVLSHPQALAQCNQFLAGMNQIGLIPHADTAGSAKEISETKRKDRAAIASRLAADIYDLEILAENIHNKDDNTTRFLVMTRQGLVKKPPLIDETDNGLNHYITSVAYQLRSVPAALYKTLGGFATGGINLVKLESYIDMGKNKEAWFYIEIMAHPDDKAMQQAMRELELFTHQVRVLGVYKASDWRGS